MNPRRPGVAAAAVIAALALWHIVVGGLVGLGDAEALYYCYSRQLAGGYLDHPPLIGWLIAAVTALLGDNPAAVRLVPTLCHGATLAGAFVLGRECFGPVEAWRGVVALALVPMLTIGGVAAAPDAPAAALWIWTAVALGRMFRRVREAGSPPRFRDAFVIGLLLGATFLAKYTGVLLVVSALAALAHPEHRGLLRRGGWWRLVLAAVTCLAVVSPVLWWNNAHGWASVAHRFLQSTQDGFGPSLITLGATLGGQLAYLGPPMAVALCWALVALVRRRTSPELYLLLCCSALPLAFTYTLCLLSPAAEPHWPVQGYLTLAVALGGLLPEPGAWRRAARVTAWSAAGLLAVALVALHLLVWTTALADLLGADRYEPRYDLTNELHGWPEVARRSLELRRAGEPLAGSHYTICSQLRFNLVRTTGRDAARVLCLSPERDDFDIWGDGSAGDEASVLYVEDDRFGTPAAEVFPDRQLTEVGTAEVRRGPWTVRRFRFVRAAVNPRARP